MIVLLLRLVRIPATLQVISAAAPRVVLGKILLIATSISVRTAICMFTGVILLVIVWIREATVWAAPAPMPQSANP
jgi:hypothetical protein